MASREHKIVRRAEAMTQLGFLSSLLAEHLKVSLPDVAATHRDPELAEIQRIENINALLEKAVEAVSVETEKKPITKPVKHGANK